MYNNMDGKIMLIRSIALAASAAFTVSACAPGPYLDKSRLQDDLSAHVDNTVYPVKQISADVIMAQFKQTATPPVLKAGEGDLSKYDYHIGPKDILGVTIWDHPELMSGNAGGAAGGADAGAAAGGAIGGVPPLPGNAQGGAGADTAGHRVALDGTIFFPYLGRVKVAGLTTEQVRLDLTKRLARTIRDPQVDVRVMQYRSQQVQITGELKNPGTFALNDVPLTLVDAVARAGGTLTTADTGHVHLTRAGKTYTLSMDDVLDRGDAQQNVLLRAGDIVNIPDRADTRVFVLGEVVKPQAVAMNRNGLTLADAVAAVNSLEPTSADPRQIYVIRGAKDKPTAPEVFRLDMTQIDALLLQTQFALQPLDVVYVGTAPLARFNRVLNQISPTLQTLFYTRGLIRGDY
jgi:polysaccharide export outer membrane protein